MKTWSMAIRSEIENRPSGSYTPYPIFASSWSSAAAVAAKPGVLSLATAKTPETAATAMVSHSQATALFELRIMTVVLEDHCGTDAEHCRVPDGPQTVRVGGIDDAAAGVDYVLEIGLQGPLPGRQLHLISKGS